MRLYIVIESANGVDSGYFGPLPSQTQAMDYADKRSKETDPVFSYRVDQLLTLPESHVPPVIHQEGEEPNLVMFKVSDSGLDTLNTLLDYSDSESIENARWAVKRLVRAEEIRKARGNG